jgi:hypothetical protein
VDVFEFMEKQAIPADVVTYISLKDALI